MPDPAPTSQTKRPGRVGKGLVSFFKPYPGQPPPGLYRRTSSDLLIRLAGTVLPHFLSVVMRLGDDEELLELPWSLNRHTMRVSARRLVARNPDVVELTFVPAEGDGLRRWHVGAHIDVYLPSGRVRQYSLCGDPDRTDEFRIAVRRIADGGGGSIEMHSLTVGQMVEVSDPRNGFMMPLPGSGSQAEKLRFIAGGIGITPILPMVRLAERLGLTWSLCFTGRDFDSLPFADELRSMGDKVRVRTDDECGLPTAAELLDDADARTAVYVCGPVPMMELVRRHVAPESGTEMHFERFSPLPVSDGEPFELELSHSGQLIAVAADQTALSALRAARPDVGYSCRQGFCGTCVQRVLAGQVDHRDSRLTDRQRDDGDMLVCISRAALAGGRLVLDL